MSDQPAKATAETGVEMAERLARAGTVLRRVSCMLLFSLSAFTVTTVAATADAERIDTVSIDARSAVTDSQPTEHRVTDNGLTGSVNETAVGLAGPVNRLSLYPDHAELVLFGSLADSGSGVHQQLLPLPEGANSQLQDILGLILPDGASLTEIASVAAESHPWPRQLAGQRVQLLAADNSGWREGVIQTVVAGDTLVVALTGPEEPAKATELELLPPADWSRLRLSPQLLPSLSTSQQQSDGFELHYQNRHPLTDTGYQLRLAYGGLQWQMRYQLQPDRAGQQRLRAELVLNNHGEMALSADTFTLVPLANRRPRPVRREVMADDAPLAATVPAVRSGSELGSRRYSIRYPLALAAGQNKRLALAEVVTEEVTHSLLVRDRLFSAWGSHSLPQRQLKLRWPHQAMALPGGELQLLSSDGLQTLGSGTLQPLEPGAEQTLLLGSTSLVSIEKQFLAQDRQSARLQLTFTNHSQQRQLLEYWLQGVRQVDQQIVPAAEGYRLQFTLAAGESRQLELQGWRAE